MTKRIALNRVPAKSDVRDEHDDGEIVQIEVAGKDPHQINGMIRSGALAP
jgi:hypothetical protein